MGDLEVHGYGCGRWRELSEVFHWSLVTYHWRSRERPIGRDHLVGRARRGRRSPGRAGIHVPGSPERDHEFTIGPLPGYDVTPSLGSVTVHGLQVFQVITFKSSSSPVLFLRLPVTEGYGVLGGIVVANPRGDDGGAPAAEAWRVGPRRSRRRSATPADPTDSPVFLSLPFRADASPEDFRRLV